MARRKGRQKRKNKAEFQGSWTIPVKQVVKKVFSKQQNKHVEVKEHKFTISTETNQFFVISITETKDDLLKKDKIAYWAEVADFEGSGDDDLR